MVGSSGDGFGFYASEGSNKLPFSERAIINQDIDINVFLNTLKLERIHLLPIPGANGFVWIAISGDEVSAKQFFTSVV